MKARCSGACPCAPSPASVGLLLAACASPQERCLDTATRDLRVVDGLIARLQTDIARGYGTRETTVTGPEYQFCGFPGFYGGGRHGGAFVGGPSMCLVNSARPVETPVAIDIPEAKRKLADLERKRAELSRATAQEVAQCRAQYPAP